MKICLAAVIRMRTLCKHIFASAERKFNTVIPSLGNTLTLMQECFKNIRDVDKKIRLLEFYVFGNVTVCKTEKVFQKRTGVIWSANRKIYI